MNDIATPPPQRPQSGRRGLLLFSVVLVVVGFLGGYEVANRDQGFTNPLEAFKAFSQISPNSQAVYQHVLDTIQRSYVHQPVDNQKLFYGAMDGLVRSLGDPYSTFFTPTAAASFKSDLDLSIEGIGAEIGAKDGQSVIIAPLPGTPADKAGLKAGDIIAKVDSTETTGLSVDEVVQLIRGKAGTSVVLSIVRAGKPLTVTVTRDTIVVPSVTSKTVSGDLRVVSIVSFNEQTFGTLQGIIQQLLIDKPKGIILDLRDNPGGLLESAVDVAGEFLGKQVIVRERDASGKETVDSATRDARLPDTPVVALVNGGTASAAEILAGALQDAHRATVVGSKTFGKGSVQTLEDLPDGSQLKLTIASWYTPAGRTIDKVGITPDVVVADPTASGDSNDTQLQKAISLLHAKE